MVLEKKILTVPLAQGIDAKSDPKQTPIGKLSVCENVEFSSPGRVKKVKGDQRYDFGASSAALLEESATANVATFRNLLSYENELVMYGRQRETGSGYTYNLKNGWKWFTWNKDQIKLKAVGDRTPWSHSVRSYHRARYFYVVVDHAVVGNYTCIVGASHEATTGADFATLTIVDNTTGARIKDEEQIYDNAGTAITPRWIKAIELNGDLVVITQDGTNAYLNRYVAPFFTATNGVNIASDMLAAAEDYVFDICKKKDNPGTGLWYLLFAYAYNNAAVAALKIVSMLSDGAIIHTYTDVTMTLALSVSIWPDYSFETYNQFYCAYFDSATSQLEYHTMGYSVAAGFTNLYAGRLIVALTVAAGNAFMGCAGIAEKYSGGHGLVYVENDKDFDHAVGTAPTSQQVQVYRIKQNDTSVLIHTFHNIGLASKPFQIQHDIATMNHWESRTYFVGVYYSHTSGQATYFLKSHRNQRTGWSGAPLARTLAVVGNTDAVIMPGRAMESQPGYTNHSNSYPNPIETAIADGVTFAIALPRNVQDISLQLGEYLTDPVILTLSMGYDATTIAQIGPTKQLSGSVTLDYDGSMQELGFLLAPETPAFYREVESGGYLVNGEAYCWRACYEWTDRRGQVHQSAPSGAFARTVTSGASDNVMDLCVRTLNEGDYTKSMQVRIVLYRTIAWAGVNGIYYRLPDRTIAANSRTNNFVMISDGTSDSVLALGAVLYVGADQKILENEPPPPSRAIWTYKDRLMAISADDPKNLHPSKRRSLGKGTAFSGELVRRIESGEGDLVTGGQIDDHCILFKPSSIWRIYGDGPDDTGTVGDWSSPVLVSSDIGCKDKASVVLTPAGMFFMSNKGIYLLDRALSLSYVGAPLEAYRESYDGNYEYYNTYTICRAFSDIDQHRVFFVATAPGYSQGSLLIYDYIAGTWAIRRLSAAGYGSSVGARDACMYGSFVAWVNSAQFLYVSNATYYTWRNGIAYGYDLHVATSNLHLAGLTGYQIVWSITIDGEYRSPHTLNVKLYYDDELTSTEQFAFTVTEAPYTWRVIPARQRCSSVKIEIFDTGYSGTYESFDLSGITLEVGVEAGVTRVRESRTK